jgi:Xaa-Pro aminopeptidase
MTTLLYSGYYDLDNETNPFEVDPNFYYISGCDLPNVLLLKKDKKHYVHVEIPNIQWYDSDYFVTVLKQCFNAQMIDFKELLQLLKGQKIQTLSNIKTHPKWSSLRKFPMDDSSIDHRLSKQREVKHIDEIMNIEKACTYTSAGIKHIMRLSYPSMSQIELQGLFKQSISKKGIQELSFNPITSHGKYNQYLHYIAKDRPIDKGSMVLLDLGCKYNHYCSDISRCFPISGKFTLRQKKIYNVVLRALKYALTLMKPGQHWKTITKQVQLKLYDECLKLKLVKPLQHDKDKCQLISLVMPHALGHHVGLDTHDCGPITTLRERMVVAVEPGIYFQGGTTSPHINRSVWLTYQNIGGIRLEDTITITKTGHKNLSKVTKEIAGIEKLMK